MSSYVEIAPSLEAHCSGALFLRAHATAILADIHLGYAWAMRRRGQLGPVVDNGARERLLRVVDELQPRTLVLAGDVVHAPRPSMQEGQYIEATLLALRERCELHIVLGNHDRAFLRDFSHLNCLTTREKVIDDYLIVHGDKPVTSDKTIIMGHHHPSLKLRDAAGARQSVPIFLVGPKLIVMPAFSPFAAGMDVRRDLPESLRKQLGRPVRMIAATGRRSVDLGLAS